MKARNRVGLYLDNPRKRMPEEEKLGRHIELAIQTAKAVLQRHRQGKGGRRCHCDGCYECDRFLEEMEDHLWSIRNLPVEVEVEDEIRVVSRLT
jgi:hypothetical protein